MPCFLTSICHEQLGKTRERQAGDVSMEGGE